MNRPQGTARAARGTKARTIRGLVGGVACLTLALSACGTDEEAGGSGGGAGGEAPEKLSLVLPNGAIMPFYDAYVAQEQGFFEDAGLEVEINSQDGSEPTVQALASGQADVIELTTSALIPASAARPDFDPVLFFLTESKAPFDVVVPADSDITSAADMRGKTLGVGTPDGAETVTAKGLLGGAGLKPEADYTIQPVGAGGQAVAALERGDIDAYAGGIADLAVVRARGVELRSLIPAGAPGRVGFGYWASRATLEEKGDALRAFAEGIQKAHEYIGGDAQKLVDFTAEVSPQQVEDRDVAMELAEAAIALRAPEGDATYGAVVPERWQSWFDNLVKTGAVDAAKARQPAEYYTDEFAPAP